MKRATKILAVVAVVALVAAVGCSKKNNSGTSGNKKEVKIGLIGDLTGSNSALVVPGKDAADLAFEQANAKGDLKVKITFVPLDNKEANPTTAPALAQQLISDPAVVGVIGPAFSGETAAVQPLFKQAGLVHITESATRASLTAGGFTTFFRAVGGDSDQAAASGKLAIKGKSCKTVAVIDDKSAYGQGYGDIAATTVKSLGGSVVTRQSVAPATDYTSLVGTLVDKKPDCVIYGGYEPQSSIIVKQMREKAVKSIFISGDGSKSTKFIPDAGKAAAEGVLFTCPCLDANVSTDPAAVQFVKDFKAKYNGTAPDIYAPEAYDIANMYVSVIKACGDNVTRQCVLDGITNQKDFKGLSKTFNWTTDPKALHEVTDKGVNIYEIKNGAITLDGNINTVVPG